MNNLNDIGKRIKQLREEKKLSQAELAKLIVCPQSTIGEWERLKNRIPSRKNLNKLASAFGVSIDYLLGKNNESVEEIDYLGRITSQKFIWSTRAAKAKKFSFTIIDDFLEPIVKKGDEAIFKECSTPDNGDIVAIKYEKGNMGMIRMWRQSGNQVMLSEVNIEKIEEPYFFEIEKKEKNQFLVNTKEKKVSFSIEGKLVLVNKKIDSLKTYLGIPCTFT